MFTIDTNTIAELIAYVKASNTLVGLIHADTTAEVGDINPYYNEYKNLSRQILDLYDRIPNELKGNRSRFEEPL